MKHLDPNIFVIENFITKKEQDQLLAGEYVEELKIKVSDLFTQKYKVSGLGVVRELLSGESTPAHSDQHSPECSCGYCILNLNVKKLYGVVIYLNSDYSGGELYYTKRGITHSPKENSLICHPASEDYEHEVLRVTSGTRKFISFFLSKNEDEK